METKAALERELIGTCLSHLQGEPRVLPLIAGLLALYTSQWVGASLACLWLLGAVGASFGSVSLAKHAIAGPHRSTRAVASVAAARLAHALWWGGLAFVAWRPGDAHNNLFLLLVLNASLVAFVVTSAQSRLIAAVQAAPLVALSVYLLGRQNLIPAVPYVAGFGPVLLLVAHHVRASAVNAIEVRLELARAKSELETANGELSALAATDELTEISNRRSFLSRADQEMARVRRYKQSLCAIMIDVDGFKQINDQHGHAVGDEVLRAIARELEGSLRETDLVARFGGDEFVLLLPETPLEGAGKLAERLRQTVEGLAVVSGGEGIPVTVSCGVAEWAERHAGVGELIAEADAALYRAKGAGRNRIEAFESPGA